MTGTKKNPKKFGIMGYSPLLRLNHFLVPGFGTSADPLPHGRLDYISSPTGVECKINTVWMCSLSVRLRSL